MEASARSAKIADAQQYLAMARQNAQNMQSDTGAATASSADFASTQSAREPCQGEAAYDRWISGGATTTAKATNSPQKRRSRSSECTPFVHGVRRCERCRDYRRRFPVGATRRFINTRFGVFCLIDRLICWPGEETRVERSRVADWREEVPNRRPAHQAAEDSNRDVQNTVGGIDTAQGQQRHRCDERTSTDAPQTPVGIDLTGVSAVGGYNLVSGLDIDNRTDRPRKEPTNMTTTIASYLAISQNLARYQTMTASESAVKTASEYYAANIGNVKTVDDLVGNYRLLSYALNAFGLGDQINSTALIKQVLAGGVSDPKSLANTLPNQQWKAFATAFNFGDKGAASISSSTAIQTTTRDYVEQQLESGQGQQNVGVQLALYFQRVAPTVTNAYGLLADANLLQVVQTIFGLPPSTTASSIDAQAASIQKLMPLSDLQNPAKLLQLTERFTAMYDLNYGGASGSTSSLSVAGSTASNSASAASTILGSIISSNSSALADGSGGAVFSDQLLTSLQNLRLGG